MTITTMPHEWVREQIDERLAGRGERRYSLAAGVGMATSALSKRMTGEVDWSLTELVIVAHYLGAQIEDLVAQPADAKAALAELERRRHRRSVTRRYRTTFALAA